MNKFYEFPCGCVLKWPWDVYDADRGLTFACVKSESGERLFFTLERGCRTVYSSAIDAHAQEITGGAAAMELR